MSGYAVGLLVGILMGAGATVLAVWLARPEQVGCEHEQAERYAQTVARPRTPEEVADVRERARKLMKPGGEG